MPEEIIKQHYIALAKLLKVYRTSPPNRQVLQATLQFCRELYDTSQNHPDLVFAQPQLYKTQLPYVVNLTFNTCVMSCLVAIRNKCDPAVCVQLMCGAISLLAFEQAEIEADYQNGPTKAGVQPKKLGKKNATFKKLLEAAQQPIWLACYLINPQINASSHAKIAHLKHVAKLCYVSSQLALLCTYNKQKTHLSFAQAVRKLSVQLPSNDYAILTPLLHYPSLLPPGNFVRLIDGAIKIVLINNIKGLVTKSLPTKNAKEANNPDTSIKVIPNEQVAQTYPSQPINQFSQLTKWWGEDLNTWLASHKTQVIQSPFETILPMQSAPAPLLVIQDQLSQIEADITVIVKAIEKEPDYARQLQVSASLSNRQKQPVDSIRHSLAMLGYERSSHLLLQYSLVSRLNQHYFPLQQTFLAFSQLFVFVTAELAAKTKLLTPEVASTTAYFLVSRLFTLPSLKTCLRWEVSHQEAYKVESLAKAKGANTLKQGGILLAQAWQQNKLILQALQHYDAPELNLNNKQSIAQFCYLLGLSLTKAKENYFTNRLTCSQTNGYVETALMELGIDKQALADVDQKVASNAHIFTPLN